MSSEELARFEDTHKARSIGVMPDQIVFREVEHTELVGDIVNELSISKVLFGCDWHVDKIQALTPCQLNFSLIEIYFTLNCC